MNLCIYEIEKAEAFSIYSYFKHDSNPDIETHLRMQIDVGVINSHRQLYTHSKLPDMGDTGEV
jgi:hypothetical protein